jgi:hypothetical protein
MNDEQKCVHENFNGSDLDITFIPIQMRFVETHSNKCWCFYSRFVITERIHGKTILDNFQNEMKRVHLYTPKKYRPG